MDRNAKLDEHYLDGKDKWTVHYVTSEDTKVNPGDYKEVTQFIKNGEMVGHTTWHKDKNGNDKTTPYEVGVQRIPSTAQKTNPKKK